MAVIITAFVRFVSSNRCVVIASARSPTLLRERDLLAHCPPTCRPRAPFRSGLLRQRTGVYRDEPRSHNFC
jgi:hypothetical protein